MEVPSKLKIELPYDPAIPLLGTYPKKIGILKDTCTPMFTSVLFTVVRTGKQPKCPPAEEWIKKVGRSYTREYHSAMKRNKNPALCRDVNGSGDCHTE